MFVKIVYQLTVLFLFIRQSQKPKYSHSCALQFFLFCFFFLMNADPAVNFH